MKARETLPEIYRRQAQAAERESRNHWEEFLAGRLAALRENPESAETYIEAAECYRRLKEHEAAISILSDGIRRCGPYPRLHLWLINLLAQCNRTEEAIAAAHKAAHPFPENFLMKLKEATLLPVLYDSTEELERYRHRFSEGLSRLSEQMRLDTLEQRRSTLQAFSSHVNVHLGCQARNDRELQRQYGEMVCRIMTSNYPQWSIPVSMPPVPTGGAIRVGYVCSRFRNMSASKYFLGWIREHNRERVEVHAYHVSAKSDSTTEEVRRTARHFRQLSGSLEETCAAILADQLHILVFLDAGVDPAMTQLAGLRLAPVQCAAWDYPVTTGLPTVDYFLSGDFAEPFDSYDHYSETLIRLPGTGTCYRKPIIPRGLLTRTRGDFGLRHDAVVYLCCQYAYKYLPAQDNCFVQIAKRLPNSQFVFLTPNKFVAQNFRARLERAFLAAGLRADDFCVLLPEIERFDYWNLCLLGDAVLDSIGWSGGVSTFEAIACGQPVVTLPGKFMRGRQSFAILKQLGVTDTIARDEEEYVTIAARLGSDRPWRDSIVQKMAANHDLLYYNKRCVEALEEFYGWAVGKQLQANRLPLAAAQKAAR